MLVLTRRRKERIVIGGTVEVVVLSLGPEEVKLGIKAPVEVSVHRGEVYDAIASQSRAAATAPRPAEGLVEALRRRAREEAPAAADEP